jgi:anaerobic selenocysteine-containing dehydrogenase
MAAEFIPSVCPHDCPSACSLEVERLDTRTIGRVRGARDNGYTRGVICAKVARYAERVHHEGRLTRPLVRSGAKGDGAFREASWDEALDLVADGFRAAAQRDGAEAVWPYYYAGTMGMVQRDGILRLQRAFGYSAMAKTICSSASKAGWTAGTGAALGVDPREMVESDLIVFWGCNAVSTQIQTWSLAEQARKSRGTTIAVVDPYRNPTAENADLHLPLRPGTDGALACAVMHVCFKEGYADRDYLDRYTDCPERLEEHLAQRGPDWAAVITGLAEDDIIAFARLYGRNARSFIRLGLGFTRSRNGAANAHAVSCLPAVTGAWRHSGGGALYMTSGVFKLDRTLVEGRDLPDPGARVLDMSQIGRVLTGDQAALEGGPPVTAMLIQNTNPVVVAPEGEIVAKGFARGDLFVCVHEQFMTETAAMADVVLPATSFLEHDDLYPSYGQTFLQLGPKIIEPAGEARSNHEVLSALARRFGSDHPGFRLSARELIDETLKRSGYPSVEELEKERWLDLARPFEQMHFLDGFGHPDGRFHFAAEWGDAKGGRGTRAEGEGAEKAAARRMPELPDHFDVIDESDARRPFRMVTAPARNFLNTSFSYAPTSRAREGRPTALVHPEVLAELGVGDGDRLRIGNDRGSVVVRARAFDGLQKGVVVVESVWLNADFEEGRGINLLTSADPAPPGGGAVFHDTAVWLAKP